MWFEVTRRSFSIEQIEAALRQAETGTPVADVVRRLRISEATFARWRNVYRGRAPGELRPGRSAER